MPRHLQSCLLALIFSLVWSIGFAETDPPDSTLDVSPELFEKIKAIQSGDLYIPTSRGNASASITSPSAAGGAGTIASVGIMYVDHWATTRREDGNMSLALSTGDPRKYVGLLFSATIDSIGINHAFAKNGGFGFRINRYILQDTAVAIGISNLGGWNAWQGNPNTFYAAVTQSAALGDMPLSLNAGFGTGSLESMSATDDTRAKGFGSIGLGLFKNFSLITDYTTNQLSVGANYTIIYFRDFPAYVGVAKININQHDDTNTFFRLNAGISYTF